MPWLRSRLQFQLIVALTLFSSARTSPLPSQVVIADDGGNATVTVVGSGEILAVLDGVQTSDLQAGDVIFL